MKKTYAIWAMIAVSIVLLSATGHCASALKPYAESLETTRKGMTLWQLIVSGGSIMIFLALLSVVAGAIAVYFSLILKVDKMVPKDFAEQLIEQLRGRQIAIAKRTCEINDNLIAQVAAEGLGKMDKDPLLIGEFMERKSKELAVHFWQLLSYLADISTIAPLLGLLGTIVGMIQAFNAIALETAVVKPILLAAGVSKAMVTTAGGLIVAIPSLVFYSLFKAKLQSILRVAEDYTTDIANLLAEIARKR